MNRIVEVQNVEKYYGNKNNFTKALDDISFIVEEGEFVGIMGASGSGKTTLLNCISTIDTVTSGHILIDGKDITEMKEKNLASFRRQNLGFVFQDFNLLDTLTIEENISMALTIQRESKAVLIAEEVKKSMKELEIENIASKYPYEVSGGQKQRCACARALVHHPKLLLADEPTGALDSKAAQVLLETMQKLNEKKKATILMVTHDAFSASYCKRILFLKDGKIFNEIIRGDKTRKELFDEILDVMIFLGGNLKDVR